MNSDLVDFEKDSIKFENINFEKGVIYFLFVINKVILKETNTDVPTYNRLILREVGLIPEPIELSFMVGNYTKFNILLKIDYKKEVPVEEDKKTNENKPIISLSQILNFNSGVSFDDNIKIFSEGKTVLRGKKPIPKSSTNVQTFESSEQKNDPSYNLKKLKTLPHSYNNDEDNLNENKNENLKFLKKLSVPVVEQHIEPENNNETDSNEFFLKGSHYDSYLSKLKSDKKKEYETGREEFCKGFFIASFPQKNGKVIENSQSFPAPCGHNECSSLPSMQPEIIFRYPLEDSKGFELNNLAATICFPTGIKVCYSEKNPSMISDYVTPITTEKGERNYMVTYHFYYKIQNDIYSKLYEMHPLKHHLMKFGDSYLNLSDEEITGGVMNEIQKSLDKSQELGFRDYVYVPYCICLISKYPYVNEMRKCLQSIYTMIMKNLKDNSLDLNNLIMYLIHSIPIPEKETRVKFFIPYFNNNIQLRCPKMQDINVMNTNISNLLQLFSIDNLIIIFRLILFEKKILFIDNDYTRLSLVADNFISLLYPFQWWHTYIPIMSYEMLSILNTYMPFINGINSSFMDSVKQIFEESQNENDEEVYLIYIKENKFRLGSSLLNINKKKYKYLQDNVPALPVQKEKELKNKLKKIKDELDSYLKSNHKKKNIDLSEFDLRIRNVFIDMFVHMFHDYYKYMTFIDIDVVFNKSLFLEKINNSNDKKFYDEFCETQMFQQFCQNIVNDELKYFTSKVMDYDPYKKDLSVSVHPFKIKRTLGNKIKEDKIYIIKPEYLEINDENVETIEKKLREKFKLEEKVDEDGMFVSQERILNELGKIKKENYKNSNCYIYIIPESLKPKNQQPLQKYNSNELSMENIIFKAIQRLKLKTNLVKKDEIPEKEKDKMKETIKDFTMNIFTSKEINDEPNLKKELLKALNNPFGREFFVSILSKNVTNIILLKNNSFQLLGALIYNTLLSILNIKENNKVLEQVVILVKSTKYYGKEKKGKTSTIWNEYKAKLQGYSKIIQSNFWDKWYNIEINGKDKKDIIKAQEEIFKLCDIMIELELEKSFIKNTLLGIVEKDFGKESEGFKTINDLLLEKIRKAKYSNPKTTIKK